MKYHYWPLYQNYRARALKHGYMGMTTRQQIALDKQIFEKFIKAIIKSEVKK